MVSLHDAICMGTYCWELCFCLQMFTQIAISSAPRMCLFVVFSSILCASVFSLGVALYKTIALCATDTGRFPTSLQRPTGTNTLHDANEQKHQLTQKWKQIRLKMATIWHQIFCLCHFSYTTQWEQKKIKQLSFPVFTTANHVADSREIMSNKNKFISARNIYNIHKGSFTGVSKGCSLYSISHDNAAI